MSVIRAMDEPNYANGWRAVSPTILRVLAPSRGPALVNSRSTAADNRFVVVYFCADLAGGEDVPCLMLHTVRGTDVQGRQAKARQVSTTHWTAGTCLVWVWTTFCLVNEHHPKAHD